MFNLFILALASGGPRRPYLARILRTPQRTQELVGFRKVRTRWLFILTPGNVFLWVDEDSERLAKVRAGQIVVSPVGAQNPKRVPSGLIHDWMGAAFIADATLQDVLQVVRDYDRYKEIYLPTVIDSRVMDTGETKDSSSASRAMPNGTVVSMSNSRRLD